MAIFAIHSSSKSDEGTWQSYFVCQAAYSCIEVMLAEGAFTLALCDSFCSNLDGYLKWAKLPFLIWCLHPLTLGGEVIAKNALGKLTGFVDMNESRFKQLWFLFVLLCLVCLGLVFYEQKALAVSAIKPWQSMMMCILFPIIGSLYALARGVSLVEENFYLKYFILQQLLVLAEQQQMANIVGCISCVKPVNWFLGVITMTAGDFWVLFKLGFFAFCYSPIFKWAKFAYELIVQPLQAIIHNQVENILGKEFKLSLKMVTGEINAAKVELVLGVCISQVIYVKYFTSDTLPVWTDFALTLGYPLVMAIQAIHSAASGDEGIWHSYFVCYAFLELLQILLKEGFMSLVFCDAFVASIGGFLDQGRLPFLIWCLHPLTYGCQVIVTSTVGKITSLLTMDERKFNLLFLLVAGSAAVFLAYESQHAGRLATTALHPWQLQILMIVFPLVASIYNLVAGLNLVEANYYLKYWIIYQTLVVLETYFRGELVGCLSCMVPVNFALGKLSVGIEDFYIFLKLALLALCQGPLFAWAKFVQALFIEPLQTAIKLTVDFLISIVQMDVWIWPFWRNLSFINKSNLFNMVFAGAILQVMYLMFWLKQTLPDYTVIAITLIYPTVMAIIEVRKESAETQNWHCYFVCWATLLYKDILYKDGVFNWIFQESCTSPIYFQVEQLKVPFLVWCMLPMTNGAGVMVTQFFGKAAGLVTMNETRFKFLFLGIIGTAVGFLGYLIFVEKSLKIAALLPSQIATLTMLFPLIASIQNVAGGVKIVSQYFQVKQWILFCLIYLLDHFCKAEVLNALSKLDFITSKLSLTVADFWVLAKIVFLILCQSPVIQGAYQVYNSFFQVLKLRGKDIVNIAIVVGITQVIYLMFFTSETLPVWTELALVLGLPTLFAIIALQTANGEQEQWLSYFIIFAILSLAEVLLATFLPKYNKYINLCKVPILLVSMHPFTDEICKFFVQKILGIICMVIKLEAKVFHFIYYAVLAVMAAFLAYAQQLNSNIKVDALAEWTVLLLVLAFPLIASLQTAAGKVQVGETDLYLKYWVVQATLVFGELQCKEYIVAALACVKPFNWIITTCGMSMSEFQAIFRLLFLQFCQSPVFKIAKQFYGVVIATIQEAIASPLKNVNSQLKID